MRRRITILVTLITLTLITTLTSSAADCAKAGKTCADAQDVIYATCRSQGGTVSACTFDAVDFYYSCMAEYGCSKPN